MATLKTVTTLLFLLLPNPSSRATNSVNNTGFIRTTPQSPLIWNEYEGDDDSYWRSISPFKPIQDRSYGTITIKNSFYMKFNLIWHGLSDLTRNNRPYEGVFRIGTQSQNVADCSGHATRYPALYLDRNQQKMQFSLSDDVDCWGVGLLNASYRIQKNMLYTITIHYNMSWVMIQLDDKVLYDDKRPGATPLSMISLPASVMISDSLDPAANVTLFDIIIVSYDEILTMPPSFTSTVLPTITSTNIPDITDSTIITQETVETTDQEIIGDADTFFVEVVINAAYEETYGAHNDTLNGTVIELIVLNIFPYNNSTNFTTIYATVDGDGNNIKVNIGTPMQNKEEVDALIAYLQYNLTTDFIRDMSEAYPWCNVVEVSYEVTVREIYIKHNIDSVDANTQRIPFDRNTVIYIVVGVIILCLCSFALLSCILCGYCRLKQKVDDMEKENEMRHNNSVSITNDRVVHNISDDHDNTEKIAKEFQRLSQSLSGLQMSGSAEEISLETHIMHSPEGMDKTQQPLYQRVSTNLPPMDADDVSSSDVTLLDELTTANFSAKVNMNMTPNAVQHIAVASNSELSSYATVNHNKLTIMIEDQMRITNQYDAEDDIDDVSSSNSLTHSSHEAMYDEGFNGLSDLVNETNTPQNPQVTTPSHQ